MQTVYLKGPYEGSVNQHGEIRCEISNCKKHKSYKILNGHKICNFHINQINDGTIKIIYEAFPTIPIVGGNSIEEQSCHAVGCDVKNKLFFSNRGFFCNNHLKILRTIRQELYSSKQQGDMYQELFWRQEEKKFRKYSDSVHNIWITNIKKTFY